MSNKATQAPEKATFYKTARAVIGCALFKAGDIVAVRYFSRDVKGIAWFEVSAEKFPLPLPPAVLQEHILSRESPD